MTSVGTAIIVGVMTILQTLSVFILKSILQNTIKFEFKRREQAAIVAELFAEWARNPDDRTRLNQLAWETTLWLPDNLALEVNCRLANDPDAKGVKEILVEIKSLLQGKKSTLDPNKIVHFKKK